VNGFNDMVGFIWSVADLLRGDYKQAEYGKVILPLTVLRRLDCVLEPTKPAVLAKVKDLGGRVGNLDPILRRAADQPYYNVSPLDFRGLLADPEHIAQSLRLYIDAFSPGAVEVLDKYGFDAEITRLDGADLLYQVVARFTDVDLHPDNVSNLQMGYVFEELTRRFSEVATAGEHFTPREVIRLMVNLLLSDDDATLATPGIVKTVYDPACGTGGMLSTAEDWIRQHNPDARLELFGQELNPETYAICRSDMMLKGHNAQNIALGNSFSHDVHGDKSFDYMLANPPFGVEWKKIQTFVEDEAARGYAGRFGAGTPRINDGSLLFLQHMIAKMKPLSEGGSRLAIVFNGSPLFTGAAGSGESEIRRWILENDWLEGIVALPDQLFYNTGISTYFWILSNRKRPEYKGQVVLLDARDQFTKMRKSLGDKRKEISPDQIDQITRWYADALDLAANPDAPDNSRVKVFPTTAFGYQRITVERPLRLRFEVTDDAIDNVRASKPYRSLAPVDQEHLVAALTTLLPDDGTDADGTTRKAFQTALKAALTVHGVSTSAALDKVLWASVSVPDPDGELQTDRHGKPLPDPDLRDNENVPLGEQVDDYLAREVLPHVPDAWIDHTKTKTGYEIPFTRHFYVYTPPRPLAEIDADIKTLEAEIQRLLGEVTA
jgi:type I restriction enzyme M protein